MLDYQSHLAALQVTLNSLQNFINSGNSTTELKQIENIINDNFSYAVLGSNIDHLLEHDKGSDLEIDQLTKASKIWELIRNYILEVGEIRQTLESLVLDPQQYGVFEKYNTLVMKFNNDLIPRFNVLVAKLQAFFDEIRDLKHVTQHGQATDTPVTNWNWRDIILSRRTGAFMTNLLNIAQNSDSPKALSFAFGALSNYSANVAGSAYINRTVGGPRRSHPYRDRLASYTIGSWLKQNRPDLTMPINNLTAKISFGAPNAPNLPPIIKNLLMDALQETYGQFNLNRYPDLNQAYQKLINHLNLLSSFSSLPLPEPINNTLWSRMVQSLPPDTLNGSMSTTSVRPRPASSNDEGRPWWHWVVIACVILGTICKILGICRSTPTGDPNYPPIGNPNNINELDQYLTSNDALISVKVMFDLHCQLYEMANYSHKVLKLLGMIYPDSPDLGEPQFAQFTVIPQNQLSFYRRQISNKDFFLSFPNSAYEEPGTNISPFATGSNPNVFLEGSRNSVSDFGLSLWISVASRQRSELQKINRNLDADRGYKHECWEVSSGSILDNPVSVKILGYDNI